MTNGGQNRISALDGIRGIAAGAVVFYHSILHNDLSLVERVLPVPIQTLGSPRDIITKLFLTLFNGETAVFLFFVLSGCVLNLSWKKSNGTIWIAATEFGIKRVLRLYPTVVVCMLLFYFISTLGIAGFPQFTLDSVWRNSLLYQITMHGPSSTIQAEILAVPFLIAVFALVRLIGPIAYGLAIVFALYAIDSPWLVFGLPM